jgi:hypothetical protein
MKGTSFLAVVKSSPLLIAVGVAVAVVFSLSFVQYARRGGFWSPEVEARVFTTTRNGREDVANTGERRFIFQGEVYSDAERLREASAIGVAATLVAVNNRSIGSVESLLSEMSAAEALPPGIELDVLNKRLSSAFANYYVRYRQSPLGVEVVSECKGQLCGPTLLVRVPDDEFSQDALTYYIAPTNGKVSVPEAFTSSAAVLKAGWHPETFKAQLQNGKQ